ARISPAPHSTRSDDPAADPHLDERAPRIPESDASASVPTTPSSWVDAGVPPLPITTTDAASVDEAPPTRPFWPDPRPNSAAAALPHVDPQRPARADVPATMARESAVDLEVRIGTRW